MAGPGEFVDSRAGLRPCLWAVETVGRGNDDHEWDIALAEFLGEQVRSARGLRVRILKATRGEVLGHRYSECADGHHQQHRDDDDPPRRGDSQPSDAVQHSVSLSRRVIGGRGPSQAQG